MLCRINLADIPEIPSTKNIINSGIISRLTHTNSLNMRVVSYIVCVAVIAQVAYATLGPIPDPVCDAICPPDNPIVENFHLPYAGNCSIFCHCANNGNWKKECPPYLHFNNLTKVCDWPGVARCEEGTIPESGEVTDPSDNSTDTENGCNDLYCGPSDCFNTLNLINCQHYCDCDHGNMTVRECSKGLFFNPDTGNCDWEKNVVCHIFPGSPSESTTIAPPAPTKAPSGDNYCDSVCPVYSNENRSMVPFPGNCDKYCHCAVNGNWERKCPANLHFNPIINACDWPAKAQCVDAPTSSTEETPTTTEPTTSKSPSVSDECESVCPAAYSADNPNMIPFPGNCEKYCHCAVSGSWARNCPVNLHFNPSINACDWPEKAQCEETPSTSDASSAAPEPTEAPLPTGTCDNVCPNVVPIERNNHFAFPGDCTKFCHCANDGNWEKDCPLGLHFKQDMEVCDWPANANCSQ